MAVTGFSALAGADQGDVRERPKIVPDKSIPFPFAFRPFSHILAHRLHERSVMATSLCIKCGAQRSGAWVDCAACGFSPKTEDDFLYSLALSERYFGVGALAEIGLQIARTGTVRNLSPDHQALLLDAIRENAMVLALATKQRIIECPMCGQCVKIPDQERGKFTCPRCSCRLTTIAAGAAAPGSAACKALTSSDGPSIWLQKQWRPIGQSAILVLATIAAVPIVLPLLSSDRVADSESEPAAKEQTERLERSKHVDAPDLSGQAENVDLPEHIFPPSGFVQWYIASRRSSTSNAMAPFTIRAAPGANYLVKLVDVPTKEGVLIVFVKGGTEVGIEVPLGVYEIKYAAGERWYGTTYLFGPETTYTKADEIFSFDAMSSRNNSITIYRESAPHFRLRRILASEF